MSKLTERDILGILESHRDNSLGADDGELSAERAAALDHYHGRPYGDEQEGRSSIVSRDLSETVDWIMPAIMRVFMQSGNLVEFMPVGPEDEAGAEQESDYLNHVLMKDNPAFVWLHDWTKDALLLKNGYVKAWWDASENTSEEAYEGLSEAELVKVFTDLQASGAEVEVLEQDERQILIGEVPVSVYDIKLSITRRVNRARIEAVPVEEVRVSKRCRASLQDSPFTEHVTVKTRSELIEMGMPRDFVDELPALDADENDGIVRARDSVSEESDSDAGHSADRSMDEIVYCEAYLRIDVDGDGIAELRRIVTVADRIPPGEEWNERIECVPLVSTSPKRVPHRHTGESLDDELADLQRIKTTLMRQLLDNAYLTNNSEYLVNKRVHLPDFLQRIPGGIKRVKDDQPVHGAVEALSTQPIVGHLLPVVDYIDGVKENRTGISKGSTQIDADLLKQTTKGAYMEAMNKASQKVEFIIRMLAETGLKELTLLVHGMLLRHQDKARVVKLRGKYVEIDPRQWAERTDLTVKVGLGTGSEEEKREKLLVLGGLQEKIAQMGLVGPEQAYALFSDLARTLGADTPEKYALDPRSAEFQQAMAQRQQGQPNPLAEAEQIKGQFRLQAEQMQLQYKAQVEQLKREMEQQKAMLEMQAKYASDEADRRSREAIEVMKAELQAFLEGTAVDLGRPGFGAGLQEDE